MEGTGSRGAVVDDRDFIQEKDSVVFVVNNEKYYFEVVKKGRWDQQRATVGAPGTRVVSQWPYRFRAVHRA